MSDPTEAIRRQKQAELNAECAARGALEKKYGQVWNTNELGRDFDVIGFLAPYVIVTRKHDGVKGSLLFQDSPRFYFSFSPHKG